MAKRKTMRPSTRFEVFKRDKFACQYCGRAAPTVVLRVDHIHPVAEGGEDDIVNLVTACFDCNAGKGATLLSDDSALAKQRAQLEDLQERREQLEMMVQWKTGLVSLDDEAVKRVEGYFAERVGWKLNDEYRAQLKKLLAKYGVGDVLDAVTLSATKHGQRGPDGKAPPHVACAAWVYVGRVLSVQEAEKKSPGVTDLFYARGIARNRCRGKGFNDGRAMQVLRECRAAGASVDELKDIARACVNWTGWVETMTALYCRLTAAQKPAEEVSNA